MKIIRDTVAHWKAHNAPRMGAALSYYAMLSFVPLLLLLVTFASYLFNTDLVQGTLVSELSRVVGSNAAYYIESVLHTSMAREFSFIAAVVGAIVTLLGAVGVFAELDQDFDILWGTPKERVMHTSIWATVRAYIYKKFVAFSFVPLLVVLLVLVISITVFFTTLESIVSFPTSFVSLVRVVQLGAPLVLGTALFATIYRILPARKLPFRVLVFGGFVTTLLFMIGNACILAYIKLLVQTDVFGGGASLVGLLVWVYYSAQVFFLGASFTYIYSKNKGLIRERDSSKY